LLARTRDHSYSELQEALGRVAAAGERFNRNVLFTCLGSPGRPMVDQSGPVALESGDRLMMCSDGLWGNVSDARLVELLAARGISEAVPDMVELALRHGGERCDNVTALAVEWEGDPEPEQAVSTQQLDGSGFASTIQAAAGEQDPRLEMDDEEIERSVREINEAIRRSGKKIKT
jgi:serine/threonine protein phosphatase PrpC